MTMWIVLAALAVVIVGAVVAWQRRARPPEPPAIERAPVEPPREAPAIEASSVVEAPPAEPTVTTAVEPPRVDVPARPPASPPPAPPRAEPASATQAPVAPPAPMLASPVVAPAPEARAPEAVRAPEPAAPPAAPSGPYAIEQPTGIQMPRTTAKPPPPLELVTQVLVLERATPAQWESALAIESVDAASPFADSLTGSLQRQLPDREGGALFRARFANGDALAIAQANLVDLKDRVDRRNAQPAKADPARDPAFAAWLDGAASAALAGQALAAWARSRHLGALDAELAELKAAIATLQARLDPEALRLLKGASQDLSRFLREAREGYAAALRKPVFLERVQGACGESAAMWSRLEARVEAIRAQLAAQADAPRLGEVQLERAVAALRALHEERRVQALGARLLGAIHGLRIALGAPRPPVGTGVLEQARDRWRAAAAAKRALLDRLLERVRTAKAPEYAGKGEFESNRTAARTSYERLVAAGADATGVALEAACAAEVRGFLDGEADDFMLYLRVAPDGRVAEWRRAPLERAPRAADAPREATAGAAAP